MNLQNVYELCARTKVKYEYKSLQNDSGVDFEHTVIRLSANFGWFGTRNMTNFICIHSTHIWYTS